MLNIALIESTMQQRGMNQAELANRCQVSREAVSRWLAGESIPRPLKLQRIANTLKLNIADLLIPTPAPSWETAPAGAPPTLSREARETLLDSSWRIREIAHLVEAPCFETLRLRNPSLDDAYLAMAVRAVKDSAHAAFDGMLTTHEMVNLSLAAGTVLLPCPWLGDREGQAAPYVVQPSAADDTWVVFGLNTAPSALVAVLAYAMGLQYCRGSLEGESAREFGRKFAAALTASAPLDHDEEYATVAEMYFDGITEVPTPAFILECEKIFQTSAYRAVAEFQRQEGGRNPAFIASLLNVSLGAAVAWSYVLSDRVTDEARARALEALS